MMSPRRSLKHKGKKHQNISFATQNRIINIRIRIKTFEMPIFCFVKWTVQYKQSTFEFLEVTINQKVANFSFKAIIASRGYHVYKETSWSNAKLNDEVKVELETDVKSLSTEPYACAIKARHSYFVGWKIVGHIPREISRYVYFFY